MAASYTYLLLDLDGTITDSMEGITHSVQHALAHFGIQVDDLNTLCPFIGPPLKDSFRDFYHFNEEQVEEAVLKYREYFSVKGIFENRLYEGIREFLEEQQAAGKQIALATSKPEHYARKILDYFDLTRYFTFISGGSLDDKRSEKEEVIRYILDSLSIASPNSSAIMIGDRKFDIIGAHANGLKAIGVLYGYGSREELIQAGADYLALDLEELSSLLNGGR